MSSMNMTLYFGLSRVARKAAICVRVTPSVVNTLQSKSVSNFGMICLRTYSPCCAV